MLARIQDSSWNLRDMHPRYGGSDELRGRNRAREKRALRRELEHEVTAPNPSPVFEPCSDYDPDLLSRVWVVLAEQDEIVHTLPIDYDGGWTSESQPRN